MVCPGRSLSSPHTVGAAAEATCRLIFLGPPLDSTAPVQSGRTAGPEFGPVARGQSCTHAAARPDLGNLPPGPVLAPSPVSHPNTEGPVALRDPSGWRATGRREPEHPDRSTSPLRHGTSSGEISTFFTEIWACLSKPMVPLPVTQTAPAAESPNGLLLPAPTTCSRSC